MFSRFHVFILSVGFMGLGIYIIIEKEILQDVHISNWDVSAKPYIAYMIGSLLFIYGAYIFRYLIKNDKEKRTLQKQLSDTLPDMNLFHIFMFILLTFPLWLVIFSTITD